MTFSGALLAGRETELVETVASIEEKPGASGPLTFVTVDRVVSQAGEIRVRERQTIVYTSTPPAPREDDSEPPPPAAWSQDTATDPVLLFAFSAATSNSHRIHYDLGYATQVEGYPGLVVHGPLIALLLLDAMPRQAISRFSFRALKPAFAGETVTAEGRLTDDGADLWGRCGDATLMRARVAF